MKANVKLLRKRRIFSEHFKGQVVCSFESGQYTVIQLGKLYQIQPAVIYRWIYKYSTFNEKGYRIVEHKQSSTNRVKELENQIKELEATVGRKQIKIDFLETMIDVAKDELDIDIIKKYSTPQSNASDKEDNA